MGGLGLAAGPGIEIGKEHHTDHGEEGGGDTAVHAVFVDFIDGKDPALVWGVELGLGF